MFINFKAFWNQYHPCQILFKNPCTCIAKRVFLESHRSRNWKIMKKYMLFKIFLAKNVFERCLLFMLWDETSFFTILSHHYISYPLSCSCHECKIICMTLMNQWLSRQFPIQIQQQQISQVLKFWKHLLIHTHTILIKKIKQYKMVSRFFWSLLCRYTSRNGRWRSAVLVCSSKWRSFWFQWA